VTAIVGFNCGDGVVLGADTEESWPDSKVYTHKIFPVERPQWKLAVAGAGIGYLIDYAKDKIVAALHSGLTSSNVESGLAEVLNRLYSNEFRRYPVAAPHELRVQLLVGIHFTNEPAAPSLFECESNLISRVQPGRSRVLGTGELLKEVGVQLAGFGLDVSLAEWASLYIIHQAKQRFGGVGGKTHTFILKNNGSFLYRLGSDSPKKEPILDAFARVAQLMMLSLDPSVSDEGFKNCFDAVKKWSTEARKALKIIERERGQVPHESIVLRNRAIERMIRSINRATRLASQKSEPEP